MLLCKWWIVKMSYKHSNVLMFLTLVIQDQTARSITKLKQLVKLIRIANGKLVAVEHALIMGTGILVIWIQIKETATAAMIAPGNQEVVEAEVEAPHATSHQPIPSLNQAQPTINIRLGHSS